MRHIYVGFLKRSAPCTAQSAKKIRWSATGNTVFPFWLHRKASDSAALLLQLNPPDHFSGCKYTVWQRRIGPSRHFQPLQIEEWETTTNQRYGVKHTRLLYTNQLPIYLDNLPGLQTLQ